MGRLLSAPAVAAILLVCALRIQPASNVNAADVAPRSRSTLRVGIWTLWRDREVMVELAGTNSKVTLRTCKGCAALRLALPVEIRAAGDAVALGGAGNAERARQIWIEGPVKLAAHGETVTQRNPVTIRTRAGVLEIVVTMPVESYVERVVASESTAADTMESLKALAIVVRTFALHETHGHRDYDLCDSTHCQLLRRGAEGERGSAAHAATLQTAGETLWFHGQRALAYFSKDCGGRTAAQDEIWPHARAVPYLVSRADPYCVRDGGREWASGITHADLTAALATAGLARPGWTDLSVARRGESGRAVLVQVGGTEIPAEEFRLAVGERLGWNKIPSTWFEVNREGDRFLFHGRGWGHGVGLCQKGAAAMAEEGRTAAQILSQYFPGAYAADERTGLVWKSYSAEGFVLETLDAGDARLLPELNRARAEAAERSGLNVAAPLTVRAFASTEAFRDATLAPGSLAAFTEGNWIAIQTLRVLAGRKMLAPTLRHEFLHALVEGAAGPAAPLWLREGLVETWNGDGGVPNRSPAMKIDAVDAALAHARSEAELEAAHRAAEWYAARLMTRYGRGQVLSWLRSGVPGGVVASLGQR
ncbi:MAG TPA: SpoIID/LytB domain-containing protein [Terracidiphilus sp.]|nr:SpoIID/LytB domain-containing protein [Terracidiphilus sp.]